MGVLSPRTVVALRRRPNLVKIRLLAPFLQRYRVRAPLCQLPTAMVPLVDLVVVSRDGRYAYVKNPKVGSTTLLARMYAWQAGARFDGPQIHNEHDVLLQGRGDASAMVAALVDPDCLRFSFVRDPARRVCSAFTNFLVDRSNPRLEHHLPYLERMGYRRDQETGQNFDIFLDYIERCLATDAAYTDQHFRPQVLNLRPDLVSYAFIGRIERMADDLRALEGMLGVGLSEEVAEKRARNQSKARYDPTPEQGRRIRAIFAADYAAFGY